MVNLRIFFFGGLASYRALFNWLTPWILIPTFIAGPIFQVLFFAYVGRSAGVGSDTVAAGVCAGLRCAGAGIAMFAKPKIPTSSTPSQLIKVIGNKTPRHETVRTKLHSRIDNVACKRGSVRRVAKQLRRSKARRRTLYDAMQRHQIGLECVMAVCARKEIRCRVVKGAVRGAA